MPSLTPTTQVGRLDVVMKDTVGKRSFAFEWSADGGLTWQGGQFTTRLRMVLEVAPHSEIAVRARALGFGDTTSDYSATLTCRSL